MDLITKIAAFVLGGPGAITLFFTARQLAVRRRAHLLDVYKHTFELLDSPEIRAARRFVYEMDRDLWKEEHWLDLENREKETDYPKWKKHLEMAELIARAFDRYGLLIREGRIPVNILARFYASPALRCWYQLGPYLNAVRLRRNQTGHMWEWENLIFEIIRPGLRSNAGVWQGVSKHDKLEDWLEKAEHARKDMQSDTDYCPTTSLWEIGRWYAFWKW